jgi:hypothetical protein
MDLHDVASPFVQPGDHEELVAGGDSKQRAHPGQAERRFRGC